MRNKFALSFVIWAHRVCPSSLAFLICRCPNVNISTHTRHFLWTRDIVFLGCFILHEDRGDSESVSLLHFLFLGICSYMLSNMSRKQVLYCKGASKWIWGAVANTEFWPQFSSPRRKNFTFYLQLNTVQFCPFPSQMSRLQTFKISRNTLFQ